MSGPGQRSGGGRTGADGGRADPGRLELAEDERTGGGTGGRADPWSDGGGTGAGGGYSRGRPTSRSIARSRTSLIVVLSNEYLGGG